MIAVQDGWEIDIGPESSDGSMAFSAGTHY
jgi:hypothetical protein